MRNFRRWAFALGTLIAAGGCGSDGKKKPAAEPVETACGDGADNDGDGFADCDDLDCRLAGGSCALAPPLDRSVASTVAEAAAYLYTGPDPLQKDVDPKVFDPRRVAIVRGKVLDASGEALGGVELSILGHAEYGHTVSRPDGMFDMAVNGGSRLVFVYQGDGLLSAQRAIVPGWERYAQLPDVGLIAESASSSKVSGDAGSAQIAAGDAVEDANGSRQPFVVFQPGTTATITAADGTEQELGTLNVHVTEYPFEATTTGSRFTPGSAPSSGLQYTLEFTVDQAQDAGATGVRFSNPVSVYVDNFLKLPVGAPIPIGYYDHSAGQWQAGDGGRVIEVVSVSDGSATVDVDGDGTADDGDKLDELGITSDELTALGKRAEAGASFWRSRVHHFSTQGEFIPVTAPAGAVAPTGGDAFGRQLEVASRRGPVLVEPQALSQSVGIAGTPFSLHYQSNRTLAYGPNFQIDVPLVGATVPAGLKGVDCVVAIAGKRYTQHFDPSANLHDVVVWDGTDVENRLLQGPQTADVTITYVYDGVIHLGPLFSAAGSDFTIDKTILPFIPDATLTETSSVTVGVWDAKGYDLGGFAIDALHALDPVHQSLFFGWGDMRTGDNVGLVVTQPAKAFDLGSPDSMASAPDGSVLVTDDSNGRILRIDRDGNISVVVGTGAAGDAGNVSLSSPQGIVETSDGTLIIADWIQDAVRAVHPDGSLENLVSGLESDNPVVLQDLTDLDGIALGPREELYIVNADQVLRYEAGALTVFAGGGDGDDDVPATAAKLVIPSGVAVAPDGSVFISERGTDPNDTSVTQQPGGHRVRKVTSDGIIRTVAGNTTGGFSGDGGMATMAQLNGPRGIALAPDGTLYISDQNNNRIRRVTPDGMIQTVVGGGTTAIDEGQLPTEVVLDSPDGIALGRDGALYIATATKVFEVSTALPEMSNQDTLFPSRDSQTLYKFDHRGKHLATIDAMTGVTELTFGYDDKGHLASITDVNGLVTKIERDSAGQFSAVLAPFGQRTELTLDADGAIKTVADPLGRGIAFTYENNLLSSTTDPKTGLYKFGYDLVGRLKDVTDPTGYVEKYERQVTDGGFGSTVTASTPEGRATVFALRNLPGRIQERGIRGPDQSEIQMHDALDYDHRTYKDGTVTDEFYGSDSLFGMQSPALSETTTTTPSGRTLSAYPLRMKSVTDPNNALTLDAWLERVDINDRTYESVYKRADNTITDTSPMGRVTTKTLDSHGRISDWSAPGRPSVHWEYDSAGHVKTVTTKAGSETRTQSSEYDSATGFLHASTNALSERATFTRDAVGRLSILTRPDANDIKWDLDDNDNVVFLTPPGSNGYAFEYADNNKTNLLTTTTPPVVNGAATSGFSVGQTRYDYQGNDKLLALVTRSDGSAIGFGYDPKGGQLTKIGLADADLSFGYDGAGKLTSVNRSDSVRVDLGFDGPIWTSTRWSGAITGSITADYDENFWLSTLTVNDQISASYSYDSDGLVTAVSSASASLVVTRDPATGVVTDTTLGTTATAQSYSGFGELASLTASHGATTDFSESIERDKLGRVSHITETTQNEVHDLYYTYDNVGRVTDAQRDTNTTHYDYDANGNRIALSLNGTKTAGGSYDAQDRILSYGTQTYEQTAVGDLFRRTDGTTAVELNYDELGNLMQAGVSDGTTSETVQYVVDGFGRRVARKVNGVFDRAWLYRDALRPIAEIDSDGTFTFFVYIGGSSAPDFLMRTGVAYRIVKDHRGSVRLVLNAQTGALAQRLEYDEFGRVTQDTNPGFQPFGFAGGLYDPASKLVRIGARDYDPAMGRWTTKDPQGFGGGDTNLYAFAGNDPINVVDPTNLDLTPITEVPGRPPVVRPSYAWLLDVGPSTSPIQEGGSAPYVSPEVIGIPPQPAPVTAVGLGGNLSLFPVPTSPAIGVNGGLAFGEDGKRYYFLSFQYGMSTPTAGGGPFVGRYKSREALENSSTAEAPLFPVLPWLRDWSAGQSVALEGTEVVGQTASLTRGFTPGSIGYYRTKTIVKEF